MSRWILDKNRDLAETVFGRDRTQRGWEKPDERYERCLDDEWQAAKLTPIIVGGAAVAVFGGMVGLSPNTRKAAAGIAALMFIAI